MKTIMDINKTLNQYGYDMVNKSISKNTKSNRIKEREVIVNKYVNQNNK